MAPIVEVTTCLRASDLAAGLQTPRPSVNVSFDRAKAPAIRANDPGDEPLAVTLDVSAGLDSRPTKTEKPHLNDLGITHDARMAGT
jgi:hypothetical protein